MPSRQEFIGTVETSLRDAEQKVGRLKTAAQQRIASLNDIVSALSAKTGKIGKTLQDLKTATDENWSQEKDSAEDAIRQFDAQVAADTPKVR